VAEQLTGRPRRYVGGDVIQAYLKGQSAAHERWHLRPPPNFRQFDERGVPIVWLLNTPLYGQGDAGRIGYRTTHTQLVQQGFARSHHDPCLYVKGFSDGTIVDLALYVDDMFITSDAGDRLEAELG
jgi:hypothetical protein